MNAKSQARLSTLREYILWGERCLDDANLVFGHGTDNALDEAAWLAGSAIGIAPQEVDAQLDRALAPSEQAGVRALIEARIATRKPAAYLLHEAWFAGLRFYVDERVIVPRSLVGEFILEEFQPWIKKDRVRAALDLCTGSGCIAVALAKTFTAARVDAVDISPDALEVARINIANHRLEERVRLLRSDLFSSLTNERYDLIVTNPPYVGSVEFDHLPPEYRHEPAIALASGSDGLDAVSRILAQARDHLTPGGLLVVEVGNSRDALEARYPNVPFMWLTNATGDECVFLLDAQQLDAQRAAFRA